MTSGELPEPTFRIILTQLVAQVLAELGDVPNPVSGRKETSLPRARFTIGLLRVLRDKTRGNLDDEEERLFEECLTELEKRYAAHSAGT